ncbi:related to RNA annealing protein [Claviceps purpurea 20.1]|uniref:Related to RNA annealing protein n=1 Tax=Claviceps purpurea (strain 20.1) TaxID=1111077 RepID=M1W932_CLAP2|nr:related to RNA annealing protein [Claviceps purpurea 20.1]
MSSKLDKPLDDIVSAKRLSARNRRSTQRRSTDTRPSAPAGGIQKNSKPARGAAGKPALAKAITTGESKVIVSNLPKDVSEQQIKEYFVQVVGPIKRVDLVYGPNSMSRGIANVSFHKSDGASKAYQKLNGLLVDNRPIKIEIVVGAAHVDKVLPAVKSLAERTAQPKQPKAQPRSAASTKGANNGAAKSGNGANGAANKKRRGRNARPVKKTADELDTEMANYFSGAADGANNAAAGGAANEASVDASMEDAILPMLLY